MKIAIIGSGIVGTATAFAFFRKTRFELSLYDISPSQLEKAKDVLDGDVSYTNDISSALEDSSYAMICVPTPISHSNEPYDYRFVDEALEAVVSSKPSNCIPIIRSTVDPFKVRQLARHYGEVWMAPEFLREASYLEDSLNPGRIIVGFPEITSENGVRAIELFKAFSPPAPLHCTTLETACLIKLASNAFLATKISFFNELHAIFQSIPNVDLREVELGVSMDARIGNYGVRGGRPYDGKCLPKDTSALLKMFNLKVLTAVDDVNKTMMRSEQIVAR